VLLAHWLGSRLGTRVELDCADAGELEEVAVDGTPVDVDRPPAATPSGLLSDQLEIFGRDRIYEETLHNV
jgi:hypothetical protein